MLGTARLSVGLLCIKPVFNLKDSRDGIVYPEFVNRGKRTKHQLY
jgi:hypothetical protein